MYSSVSLTNGTYVLRMQTSGLAATKGFTHGRVSFDPEKETVQFSHHPPLPLPGFRKVVTEGAVLPFALAGPDGDLRKQRRDVCVQKNRAGQLFAQGIAKTPSTRSREEGWRTRVFKFRAYFTHKGIETEPLIAPNRVALPAWLEQSISRQRRFWNRLASLCADARYACRPVQHDEFLSFMNDTVLPAVDSFNNSLGRSRLRIRTDKLRRPDVSVFALSRFGAFLNHLEEEGKPVPDGLAARILKFVNGVKLDYMPINEFQRNLNQIMKEERYLEDAQRVAFEGEDGKRVVRTVYRRLTDPAEIEARRPELELRDWEWKPTCAAFVSTLKRRKTLGLLFSEGWPKFRSADRSRWSLHYYLNGGAAAGLLFGGGIRGLKIGAPVSLEATGSTMQPGSRDALRNMCPARISFRDALSRQQWEFRFAVLRHNHPFPATAQIKEWKLIYNEKGLWLCLVVEAQFAKPLTASGEVGAVHIGWRKEKEEIWPALVYDPAGQGCEAFHRVIVDETRSPEQTQQHTPFRVNMGCSKWGRRSILWISGHPPHLRVEPGTPDAIRVLDTWDGLELLQKWRDSRKNVFKSLLQSSLDPAPPALEKAGLRTLHHLGGSFIDPNLSRAYKAWAEEDRAIGDQITQLSARISGRLEKGYELVARDICRLFADHGVSTIAVQESLLSQVSRKRSRPSENGAADTILKNSQTSRQRVSPALLLQKVRNVAEQYGLAVLAVNNSFISRRHCDGDGCNHTNPASPNRLITCEKCGKVYDQDENAARNMVEAASASPPSDAAD